MTRLTTDWFTRGWRALALAAAFSGPAITLAQRPQPAAPQAPPGGATAPAATPAAPWAGAIEIDPSTIQPRDGKSYLVNLPQFEGEADASGMAQRSNWVLLEDDLPLGPAHAIHAEVGSDGAGRYSHWRSSLIFSTSDDSDPRVNGKRYTLIRGVDGEGHRLLVPGAGEILILHRGERLWWRDQNPVETFAPTFGARRAEVNPAQPQRDGPTLIFDTPGEYGLRGGRRAAKVLVLHDDRQQWARQITGFVAANTTGGRDDEPQPGEDGINWPAVSRAEFHHLFSTDDSLDVACGYSARLVCLLAESLGLRNRYCGWIGSDRKYAGHVTVEIYNDARQAWEMYDPHYGTCARDRLSALDLVLSLHGAHAGREAEAFTRLVDKTSPDSLAQQWQSYEAALQMWLDEARRSSLVLLMDDAVPPTIDPEAFKETEFISASTGLKRFRAQFYAAEGAPAAAKAARH